MTGPDRGGTAPESSARPGGPTLGWSSWLLAHSPVDALAQQVGMATVAGILLDHVDEDLAHRHLFFAFGQGHRRRQSQCGFDARSAYATSSLQGPPGVDDYGRISSGTVEVTVVVLRRGGTGEGIPGRRGPGGPVPLNVSQMAG